MALSKCSVLNQKLPNPSGKPVRNSLFDVMCSGEKLNEDHLLVVRIERRNPVWLQDEGISVESLLNSIWKLRKAEGGTGVQL